MNTNRKGDIAISKVIADLTTKEYDVFVPISEHCTVDLLSHKDGSIIRFQVKYSKNGRFSDYSMGRNKKITFYREDQFDYYAIYLSEIDTVVYCPSNLGKIYLRYKKPKRNISCWWYEDFLEMKKSHSKTKIIGTKQNNES